MLDGWRMRVRGWQRRCINRRIERADRHVDQRLGLVPTRTCRQDAQAVYVGDDTLLCHVQGRYFLFVPSRDVNVTPALAAFGRLDPWLSRVIARAAQPGMIVADVGANVGYLTMLLADRVGPHGRVHAFEPNVQLTRLIERSALANHFGSRIVIHPVPVGAEDGREMWLCVPGDSLAGSAIHDDEWRSQWLGDPDSIPRADREARPVVLQRLDSLPDANRIALVKLDVEGYEPEAWSGMSGLLAGDALRTIVMEYTAQHYGDPHAFRGELFRPGWSVSLIDDLSGPGPISRDALAMLDPTRPYDLLLTR